MKVTAAGHTLYLCYFGLREPLVQTQVLPYLRQVGAAGIRVSLLTFEPQPPHAWPDGLEDEWHTRLKAEGIDWRWRRYHKRPSLPATLFDTAAGAFEAIRLGRRDRIAVIHARGHVPAAMGALAARWTGSRLIFDIRGFMPEEYVDAGVWSKHGLCYRLTKWAEQRLSAAADGYVVLTERAREILFPGCTDADAAGRPIEVIPCCVDLKRFEAADAVSREQVRQELGLERRRVIVYTGALGGWYLTDEMTDFLAVAHREDETTFSMILTQSPPERIARPMAARGIRPGEFRVLQVSPDEIPRYLKAADLALSFIKPCYSKAASSPTKLAEYLASGLPVVCNAGIGDVDEVVEADRVGVLLHRLGPDAYAAALAEADLLRRDPDLPRRCRASARLRFDVETVGGKRYRRLYRRLLAGETTGPAMSGAAP